MLIPQINKQYQPLRPLLSAQIYPKTKSLRFGDESDVAIAQAFLNSRAGMLADNKLMRQSPFFKWRISKQPIKKIIGRMADWTYWLWQGFVKDLKHLQQLLFKPSKPSAEKPS